jgi:hypothetical protein
MTLEGAASEGEKGGKLMKKMEFKVRQVRECLVREGRVFSVRGYYTYDDDVYVDGVGWCYRKLVKEVVTKHDLLSFVTCSGFASVDDWWKLIKVFVGQERMWLYYVTAKRVGA